MGAAALAYALLGDSIVKRIKRWRGTARKRCPKCWYDLTHTPVQTSPVTRASRRCAVPYGTHTKDDNATDFMTTCSECGYLVKRERQFYKGRKHWKLALVAITLLFASYGVHIAPGVKERGWVAAVPTTALILALPWLEPDEVDAVAWLSPAPSQPQLLRGLLLQELVTQRVTDGHVWSWQALLLAELCIWGELHETDKERSRYAVRFGSGDPKSRFEIIARYGIGSGIFSRWSVGRMTRLSEIRIETRKAWPESVAPLGQIHARVWPESPFIRVRIEPREDSLHAHTVPGEHLEFYSGLYVPWDENRVSLGSLEGIKSDVAQYDLVYELCVVDSDTVTPALPRLFRIPQSCEFVEVHRDDLHVETRVAGTVEEHLTAVQINPHAHVLLASAQSVLTIRSGGCSIDFGWDWRNVVRAFEPATLAVRCEVLADGVPVADGFAWWRSEFERDANNGPGGTHLTLSYHGDLDPVALTEAEFTVRLIGDPAIALRDFGATQYWSGEVELTPRVYGLWLWH